MNASAPEALGSRPNTLHVPWRYCNRRSVSGFPYISPSLDGREPLTRAVRTALLVEGGILLVRGEEVTTLLTFPLRLCSFNKGTDKLCVFSIGNKDNWVILDCPCLPRLPLVATAGCGPVPHSRRGGHGWEARGPGNLLVFWVGGGHHAPP